MTITKNTFKITTGLVVTSLFLSFVSPALAEDQHFEETVADGQATMVSDVHVNEGTTLTADATITEFESEAAPPQQESTQPEETPITETQGTDTNPESAPEEPTTTSDSFTNTIEETVTLSSCPIEADAEVASTAQPETDSAPNPTPESLEVELTETDSNLEPAPGTVEQDEVVSQEAVLPDSVPEATATNETTNTTLNQEDCDNPAATIEAVKQEKSAEETLTIINVGDVEVETTLVTKGHTGHNTVASKTDDVTETDLTSGTINVFANVLTIVNTNSINSRLTTIADNFEQLATDLSMRFPDSSLGERAQQLVAGVCEDDGVDCQSFSAFVMSNNNTANVAVDASVSGDSGHNTIFAGDNVVQSRLKTGDVNAVVNVLNIVNTNLINSRWTIVSYNIFGDYHKNIILPSQLELTQFLSLGTSSPDLENVEQVFININNKNKATIENNVTASATTGHDTIQSLSDDIQDSSAASGNAGTLVTVNNVYNNNILNAKWYLGIVNFMQGWTGQTYSLPEQVILSGDGMGLTLFSMSGVVTEQLEGLITGSDDTVIEGQNDTTTTDTEASTSTGDADTYLLDVDNENTAVLTNNVSVSANTGFNDIIAGDNVIDSHLRTGTARALANVINFVNTNLINADVYVGVVNIFGKWTGNLLFGYPDLQVTQQGPNTAEPIPTKSKEQFLLKYANISGAQADSVTLEWKFDPNKLEFTEAHSPFSYTIPEPGTIVFRLGKLAPNAAGTITVDMLVLVPKGTSTELSSYSRIATPGPEQILSNNEHWLTLALTTQQTLGSGSALPSGEAGTGAQTQGSQTNPANSTQPAQGASNTEAAGSVNQDIGGVSAQETANTQTNTGQEQQTQQQQQAETNTAGQNGQQNAEATNNTQQQNQAQNGQGQQVLPVTSAMPFAVTKKNSAPGPVGPGSAIDFTISVKNISSKKLTLVTLQDTLHGPGNQVYGQQILDIGDIQAGETVEINYTLPLPVDAPLGTYVNAAFARGITWNFQTIDSYTATSTFTLSIGAPIVQGQEQIEEAQPEQEDQQNLEDEEILVKEEVNESVAGNEEEDGEVLGAVVSHNGSSSGKYVPQNTTVTRKSGTVKKKKKVVVSPPASEALFWDVLGTQATDSNAASVNRVGVGALNPTSTNRQLYSTILICALIAFGYALSNAKARRGAKKFVFSEWVSKFTIF